MIQNNYTLNNLIIVSGSTGIHLDRFKKIFEEIKQKNPETKLCYFKFEDYLKKIFKIEEISVIVSTFLLTRPSANRKFIEAIKLILNESNENSCDSVIILMHLSYLIQNSIFIVNPALRYLIRQSKKAILVYIFDDILHALYRIALGHHMKVNMLKFTVLEGSSPYFEKEGAFYTLDLISYLMWRSLDISILTSYLGSKNIETYIYAVKHPYDNSIKFFEMLISGSKDYVTAYVSHPISVFRRLYNAINEKIHNSNKKVSLSEIPGVCTVIEKTKKILRKYISDLILFEPTTIDEYILGKKDLIYSFYKNIYNKYNKDPKLYGTVFIRLLERLERLSRDDSLKKVEAENNNEQQKAFTNYEEDFVPWLHIDKTTRWPIGNYPITSNEKDFLNKYLPQCFKINKTEEKDIIEFFNKLTDIINKRFLFYLLLEYGNHSYFDPSIGSDYLSTTLKDLIKTQIEARDYFYVEQSNILLVIYPLFYYITTTSNNIKSEITDNKSFLNINVNIYYALGSGVISEINRAMALGNIIVYLLIPAPLNDFFESLGLRDDEVFKLLKASKFQEIAHHNIEMPVRDSEQINEILSRVKRHTPLDFLEVENINPSVKKRMIDFYKEILRKFMNEVVRREAEWPFGKMGKGTTVLGVEDGTRLVEKVERVIKK